LTDEVDTEPIENEEASNKPCREDEEERAMQEARQATRLSEQDTAMMEDISDFI
jgi:hypothetical protein